MNVFNASADLIAALNPGDKLEQAETLLELRRLDSGRRSFGGL
jgi:hypothetical protein